MVTTIVCLVKSMRAKIRTHTADLSMGISTHILHANTAAWAFMRPVALRHLLCAHGLECAKFKFAAI